MVLMLHREEYYHVNDPDWLNEHPEKQGLAEVIITKQRNGPTGVVELRFDGSTTRFQNLSPRPAPAGFRYLNQAGRGTSFTFPLSSAP